MNGNRSRFGGAAAILLSLLVPSCGHDQQLVSISITPAVEINGASNIPVSQDAGLSVQLRAIGNYIHPPVSKDITNQVIWASDDTQIATVSATGLAVVTGFACGDALMSATVNKNSSAGGLSSAGAIVTANMTETVVCFSGTGPAITVTFAGTGAGSISSNPGGLGCSMTCTSSAFPIGTTVTLTATANGSTFGGWAGCDTVSGQMCTLTVRGTTQLAVTFN